MEFRAIFNLLGCNSPIKSKDTAAAEKHVIMPALDNKVVCICEKDERSIIELQNLPYAKLEYLKAFIDRLDQRQAKLLKAGSEEALKIEGEDADFYTKLPDCIQKCLKSHYSNMLAI